MHGAGSQLAFDLGGNASAERPRPVRKVRRDETVRLVEFAPFPRIERDPQWRHGFTLDLSPRGLCVRAKEVAPTGSLLRIILRNVDGQPALDCVARVTWSEHAPGGASRMGLEVMASKGPRVVAPPLAFVRGTPQILGASAALAS